MGGCAPSSQYSLYGWFLLFTLSLFLPTIYFLFCFLVLFMFCFLYLYFVLSPYSFFLVLFLFCSCFFSPSLFYVLSPYRFFLVLFSCIILVSFSLSLFYVACLLFHLTGFSYTIFNVSYCFLHALVQDFNVFFPNVLFYCFIFPSCISIAPSHCLHTLFTLCLLRAHFIPFPLYSIFSDISISSFLPHFPSFCYVRSAFPLIFYLSSSCFLPPPRHLVQLCPL